MLIREWSCKKWDACSGIGIKILKRCVCKIMWTQFAVSVGLGWVKNSAPPYPKIVLCGLTLVFFSSIVLAVVH